MMMTTPASGIHRPRPRRLGAAVVEFAVVAPILGLLTLGMIEVTRAAQVKLALADAARHGCRFAIQPGNDNAQVEAYVTNILQHNDIETADVKIVLKVNNVAKEVKTAVQNDRITITVSVALSKVGWIAPLIFGSTERQAETLSMMRQR
jgi:Flp pilus assembly protein TadG